MEWGTPTSSTYPDYPSGWYPGGSDGNALPASPTACFSASPEHPDTGVSTMFSASCSTGEGTLTYAWRVGSATSSVVGTASTYSRAFAEVGNYRIRLTVTNAGGSGLTSMLLAVGGEGAEGEPGEEDCGAWWHIFCHIKAALAFVFVPDSNALSDAWGNLSEEASGHWPLGPAIWGAQAASDLYGAFTNGCNFGTFCEGSSLGLAEGDRCEGEDSWGPEVPLGTDFDVKLPAVPCTAGDVQTGLGSVRTIVRIGTSIAFVVGFILALMRLVGVRVGGGKDGEE
ncbi:MAG: PKD domain-containing protein [Actinobacteria bacterium]|nr:PKD domain-containing protein [Actinomycetota bacterium]